MYLLMKKMVEFLGDKKGIYLANTGNGCCKSYEKILTMFKSIGFLWSLSHTLIIVH